MAKRKREPSPEIICLGSSDSESEGESQPGPSRVCRRKWIHKLLHDDGEQPSCSNSHTRSNSSFDFKCLFSSAIITKILSFLEEYDLGQVAQACSELRDFCYDPKLWAGTTATITLEQSQDPAYFEVLESLRRRDIQRINVPTYKAARLAIACIPNLTTLNVWESYVETDFSIDATFVVPMPNLTELSLSHCDQLNDNGMAMLCPLIKNVVDLNLYGSSINDTSIMRLAMSLPNLKRLNIGACSHVTNRGISYICGVGLETGEMATGNLNLEYLELSRNPHITFRALKYMSGKLTKLETLDLSFCPELSKKCLMYLSSMKALKVLFMRGCRNLVVSNADKSAVGVSPLRILDLSGSPKIGDAAVIFIADKFLRLNELKLNKTDVSNLGILVVSRTLRRLRTLELIKCSRLTVFAISSLINMKIKWIDLTGCNHLKPYFLDERFHFALFKVKARKVLLEIEEE